MMESAPSARSAGELLGVTHWRSQKKSSEPFLVIRISSLVEALKFTMNSTYFLFFSNKMITFTTDTNKVKIWKTKNTQKVRGLDLPD